MEQSSLVQEMPVEQIEQGLQVLRALLKGKAVEEVQATESEQVKGDKQGATQSPSLDPVKFGVVDQDHLGSQFFGGEIGISPIKPVKWHYDDQYRFDRDHSMSRVQRTSYFIYGVSV
ncbi:hypothetical protein [Thermoflavimicrobium dichotomicum]|uniref:Uncharacterized protein n=1 Tax=Thermoflavimicrobium dichotomicum TaxID=46223 RepID=A0A1I3ULL6_9BACL|nr:hypothetical protein [Thermoflavimicrobium dichotomicum]SFJ82647.1 hypothetical protein SAMN05421852_12515 [Thermoflavimicrobium dichotomicum]